MVEAMTHQFAIILLSRRLGLCYGNVTVYGVGDGMIVQQTGGTLRKARGRRLEL